MPLLNSTWAFAILFALISLFSIASSVASSQSESSGGSSQPLAAQSVSQWVQHRSKRAPWDWSLDALKCSLKIVSLQVSNYHDNQMMCCGLWWLKNYMKTQAVTHCGETANRSINVFDEMINENLIYSDFAKSLIGDQTADCTAYREGSPICDRFFSTITFVFIMVILTLLTIIIGFIVSLFFCIKFRKAYRDELGRRKGGPDSAYTKANSLSDLSNASNNNNPKKGFIHRFLPPLPTSRKSNQRVTPTFNVSLLKSEKEPAKLNGNSQDANGRITPLSDGRCSSASTSSSNVPEKDDKV